MRPDGLFRSQYFDLSANISRTSHKNSLGVENLGVICCACVFFHAVYPPLAEMTDEEKANSWKPGQKKKKSEKVDSTWNPKSKLVKKYNADQLLY